MRQGKSIFKGGILLPNPDLPLKVDFVATDDFANHAVDAFTYAMIGAHHAEVERTIKEILATKIYPPIRKSYSKFWMKIMLWVRGVKISKEYYSNFDTKVIVKQFGHLVAEKRVKNLKSL